MTEVSHGLTAFEVDSLSFAFCLSFFFLSGALVGVHSPYTISIHLSDCSMHSFLSLDTSQRFCFSRVIMQGCYFFLVVAW